MEHEKEIRKFENTIDNVLESGAKLLKLQSEQSQDLIESLTELQILLQDKKSLCDKCANLILGEGICGSCSGEEPVSDKE